ncbi:MAG: ArsR/SmtB family transcription factor [Planctomycetaceae bacterium]
MKTKEQYEARAKIAKALSHPSRLMIVELLQRKELCVQDLTEAVGDDQSTVSKHLTILKEAGLISHRKEGTSNFYRVTCNCLDGFFCCLEDMLKADVCKRQNALGTKRQ